MAKKKKDEEKVEQPEETAEPPAELTEEETAAAEAVVLAEEKAEEERKADQLATKALRKMIEKGGISCVVEDFHQKPDCIVLKLSTGNPKQFAKLGTMMKDRIIIAFEVAQKELPFADNPDADKGLEPEQQSLTMDGPMPPKPDSLQTPKGETADKPEGEKLEIEE